MSDLSTMRREVAARMELDIRERSDLVFCVAAARTAYFAAEQFTITLDGVVLDPDILDDLHSSRLHHLYTGAGKMTVEYTATVVGRSTPTPVYPLDLITYLRPSRYCESDAFTPTARAEFPGLHGIELLKAVSAWVSDRLIYVPGSSLPTDGALRTLMARQGVCRDYAHLVIALLRGLDIPARLVSVYAPGLYPMDFHAVAEAYVDGQWYVVDATHLAPRQSLLRIATGRDAADTAFLTNTLSDLELTRLEVMAIVDTLPFDDGDSLIQLG